MKDRIKLVVSGILGGLLGGIFVVEVHQKMSINWTALACFISVGVLIVTTYENRRRFTKDWQQKQKSEKADTLNDLISQFIGNYQKCQTVTVDILLSTPGYGRLSIDLQNRLTELKKQRNETVFALDSVISQLRMLQIRLAEEVEIENLFDKIDDIELEINNFFKENNSRDIVEQFIVSNPESNQDERFIYSNKTHERIHENCVDQDMLTKENIKYLQSEASRWYAKLTRLTN